MQFHCVLSSTQTGEVATTPGMPAPSLVDEHITLLHHQLGVASSMATQLTCSQQALISTLCRQLESLQLDDRIQDHFVRLHQYQAELEQYYQELQNVYLKVVHFIHVHVGHAYMYCSLISAQTATKLIFFVNPW